MLIASLLILAWALLRNPTPDVRMDYRFGFDRAGAGIVSVEVIIEAHAGDVVLGPLLADEILGMSAFQAVDALGAPVSIASRSKIEGVGSRARLFTRRVIGARSSGPVTLTYDVTPSPCLPPGGDNGLWRCGRVAAEGCALSLANLVLVPEGRDAEVSLDPVLPPSWVDVHRLPTAMNTRERAKLWKSALVAGRYSSASISLASGVRARLTPDAPAPMIAALRRITGILESILGPARAPIEILLPMSEPNTVAVELPGSATAVLVDVRGTDPASLRRFVTRLVPAWWGRLPLEVDLDPTPDGWFALGLRDYLARLLPARAGLVERDPGPGIENSWISNPDLSSGVALEPDNRTRNAQVVRRYRALARVYDLDTTIAGGLEADLRGYDGHGLPARLKEASFAKLVPGLSDAHVVGDHRALSFEPGWELAWDAEPPKKDPQTSVANVVTLAFSADSAGLLETCGCKANEAGGVARRATVLENWRREDPQMLLVDLGNFSATEGAKATLDPIAAGERRLYVELMEAAAYDAVIVGPDELYSGGARSFEGWSELPMGWLHGGIDFAGRTLESNAVILDRAGLRVGIVGYSELLENLDFRQALEANMAGVSFAETPAEIEPMLRALRPKVDLMVVAGRMRPASLRALADPQLGVDLILSADHHVARGTEGGSVGFLGSTAVAFDQVGRYGLQRLSLSLSAQGRIVSLRTDAVQLDSEVADHPEVRRRLDDFYLSNAAAYARVEPLFQADPLHSPEYEGSEACATCHAAAYSSWLGTPHAIATTVARPARRERSPRCVQRHVVGLGRSSGYSIAQPDSSLGSVGCENCHGAGEQHVLTPTRTNIRRTPTLSTCVECHDPKHSQSFESRFDAAWQQVLHR